MASGRRRIAIAAATVALTMPFVIGCSAVDKALDCVKTADDVAESATDLQRAVEKAGDDPLAADEALDEIEKNLGEVGDKADDADVGKAVDHLEKAVGNVRDAVKSGDTTPDVSPLVDATGELTKACKP